MMEPIIDFNKLEHILQVSKKDVLKDVLEIAFEHRNHIRLPEVQIQKIRNHLNTNQDDAYKVLKSLIILITKILVQKNINQDLLSELFPNTFNEQLRSLILDLVLNNLAKWEQDDHLPSSASKLLEFKCSTSADNECCLMLKLKNYDEEENEGSVMNLQISKECLNKMTEGLARIRTQLFAAAKC